MASTTICSAARGDRTPQWASKLGLLWCSVPAQKSEVCLVGRIQASRCKPGKSVRPKSRSDILELESVARSPLLPGDNLQRKLDESDNLMSTNDIDRKTMCDEKAQDVKLDDDDHDTSQLIFVRGFWKPVGMSTGIQHPRNNTGKAAQQNHNADAGKTPSLLQTSSTSVKQEK